MENSFINNQNPLRIGDWIKDKKGRLMQVNSLCGNTYTALCYDDKGELDEVSGNTKKDSINYVEITPEILSKIGFRQNGAPYGQLWFLVKTENGKLDEKAIKNILNGKLPHIGYNAYSKRLCIKTMETDVFVICSWVHQLQHYLSDAGFELPSGLL